jgi:hypothetical protein
MTIINGKLLLKSNQKKIFNYAECYKDLQIGALALHAPPTPPDFQAVTITHIPYV